jgi:hypothetical protein
MSALHPIYVTKHGDGFLALSNQSPRFGVGGATEQEAFEKAQRALAYYETVKSEALQAAPTKTLVISPFYEEKELCPVS